jgi:SAM-dependent MidA family methyltransferase
MHSHSSNDTPLLPILREEIRGNGGRITFARFMELCLYHPQHGYYNTERAKLGARGDFYTNAHVAPVFARLLARHLELLWNELGKPDRFDLVELGPGDGQFAAELLPWIAKRFPDFSTHFHYTAIEQSAVLRARLSETLSAFRDSVRIVESITPFSEEASRITGCIFANEFFDALPIHILVWRNGQWHERYVCLDGERLAWSEGAPGSEALETEAETRFDNDLRAKVRDHGWFAEIAPAAASYMQQIGQSLQRGEVLILDYGYALTEWWLGRFPEGSALAYREHRVIDDLLASPGEQDLTAHVNFSQLIEAGAQAGLRLWTDLPQARFLLELGEPDEFHDVFADCSSDRERQQRALLLKTLILPQGLGNTFQVLQLRQGM